MIEYFSDVEHQLWRAVISVLLIATFADLPLANDRLRLGVNSA